MRPQTTRDAYAAREVGERLGIARQTIIRYMQTGLLPSFKLGRRRLIPAWALAELLHPPNPSESLDSAPTTARGPVPRTKRKQTSGPA